MVYFEDGTLLKATEKEVLDFSLYAGREICEEERCALEKAAASSCTKNKAVAMIGARALSKKELENRRLVTGFMDMLKVFEDERLNEFYYYQENSEWKLKML